MARPDLDDDFEDEVVDEPVQPWHNSTGAVLGASAIGVAVIAALVGAVLYVTGQQSSQTPIDFVEPSFSATASPTTPTTTSTITSTTPLSTTEINPPLVPTTSGPSETSGSETSSSESSASTPRPPRQREDDEATTTRTTRRPRTNVTRTLLPQQAG